MGELRQDPATGAWTIIAPNREHRPGAPAALKSTRARLARHDGHCPFCPGNEAQLPGILAELPAADGRGWTARAVPNKFAAVGPRPPQKPPRDELYVSESAYGRQEVIIESPRHDLDITSMARADVAAALALCQQRYRLALADPNVRAAVIFRNSGAEAGASLAHPHAQLMALSVLPPLLQTRMERARRHHADAGRCLYCQIVAHELGNRRRLVMENDAFLAIVPYAASTPFEIHLLPKRHEADFADARDGEITALAAALQDVLARLARMANRPAYNYVINAAVKGEPGGAACHWFLHLRPRLTLSAGFELGAGLAINPSWPEDDAAALRDAAADA